MGAWRHIYVGDGRLKPLPHTLISSFFPITLYIFSNSKCNWRSAREEGGGRGEGETLGGVNL